jgi:hypothetical protein
MIDKQTIEERKKTITNDILTVKERLSEYEKKKVEDVALINALMSQTWFLTRRVM